MSIARDLARSLKHLERQLGNPVFTYETLDYPCVANSRTSSKSLNPGGYSPDADLVLFVRAELFPPDARPEPRDKLTYRGTVYRIDEIATLPGEGQLKLVCMEANRKA